MKRPALLREEVTQLPEAVRRHPIIIDEVQKAPMLLDEVQWLIENAQASFILCGSSARKLKRGAANLLGGRAWRYTFYPLTYQEVTDFNLLHALTNGLLPKHYTVNNAQRGLEAYVTDYLQEEIQGEGLVRHLPSFAHFIDSLRFSHGELTNYSNIARDCGIDSKTVKSYYQILIDTLLGYNLMPYHKKQKRDVISKNPKFYLFDVGLANYVTRNHITDLSGSNAGKAFEHFILMELQAYLGMERIRESLYFWRTRSGLEVDFILGEGHTAIEVKIQTEPRLSDLKGLVTFAQENQPAHALCVCQAPRARKVETNGTSIMILPWQDFLQSLWAGHYL